jgi:hypothetical protein
LALGEAELYAGERDASRATLTRVAELARAAPAPELAQAALGLPPGLSRSKPADRPSLRFLLRRRSQRSGKPTARFVRGSWRGSQSRWSGQMQRKGAMRSATRPLPLPAAWGTRGPSDLHSLHGTVCVGRRKDLPSENPS